jgi:hypothetical protein
MPSSFLKWYAVQAKIVSFSTAEQAAVAVEYGAINSENCRHRRREFSADIIRELLL